MYRCIYMYMYIYVYIHIYVRNTHICVYVYITYVYITYICIHMYMYVCIFQFQFQIRAFYQNLSYVQIGGESQVMGTLPFPGMIVCGWWDSSGSLLQPKNHGRVTEACQGILSCVLLDDMDLPIATYVGAQTCFDCTITYSSMRLCVIIWPLTTRGFRAQTLPYDLSNWL